MKTPNTDQEKLAHINSAWVQDRYAKILSDPNYSMGRDDDPFNPWPLNEDIISGSISRLDAAGIQLATLVFHGIFSKENKPSEATKQVMQKFLEGALGNQSLNAFLVQDVVKLQVDYDDYITKFSATAKVAYLTHKTRHIEEMTQVMEKVDKNYRAVLLGGEVKDEDRVSLKDFAMVSDVAKIFPILDQFYQSGFIDGNVRLETLYKNAKQAKEIMTYIDQEAAKGVKELGAGTIILDNSLKKSQVLGMVMSFFEKIVAIFSSHGHASMLHVNAKGEAQRSHINPGLVQDALDTNKYLYSNTYKIDVTALISGPDQKLMEELYGKDWKGVVATKFQIIQNQIHTDLYKNFGSLSTSSESEQRLAGLGDITPFGHKQLKTNDFKEIHHKVMSQYYANKEDHKMLCSEFCATTIIASLVELDKQIRADEKAHIQEDLELVAIEREKNIVKIPFGKHENLHRMHPDRLLATLEKYHCVEKVSIESVDKFLVQPPKDLRKAQDAKTSGIGTEAFSR